MSIITKVLDVTKSISQRLADDHLSAYVAQATFYLMLSVFPFAMLFCMASRLFPFLNEETLLQVVDLLLPEQYRGIGIDFVDSYYNENINSAKFALIIFLIWTASRLIQALMNGFNTVYGIKESRSQTILRLIGCVYIIVLCAMFLALIAMYAFGSRLVGVILEKQPDWYLLELILNITRNLASPALLLLVFWLSYTMLPSRRGRFRDEIPGALLTAVFWRGSAALYGVFLRMSMEKYSYVYGSLTGVVMLLIWLYTDVYCWFIGAELNQYLSMIRMKKRVQERVG